MAAETISRGARRFVLAGAGFLVAWQLAAVAGLPRSSLVALGLYGFVAHTAFGKAYALLPSYFVRDLAQPSAPQVQLPLSLAGAVGLAVGGLPAAPGIIGAIGAVLWAAGALTFASTIAWTIRTNPLGAETGTGEANAHRRRVDRLANGFAPVALVYLLAGSYELAAGHLGLPGLVNGSSAASSHLLAAGFAGVLVFAVGFRLLPRFLVARPPSSLVAVVLPAGAIGPALLALGVGGRPGLLRAGAVVEAAAIVGFAVAYAVLFSRSSRRRVGLVAVGIGAAAGVAGVALGAWFAFAGLAPGLADVHYRLTLLGFVGLTIVGVTYQFYPPSVGRLPGVADATAAAAVGGIAVGLAIQLVGALAGWDGLAAVGPVFALAGALVHAYVVIGVFRARR